jgi:sterol desaturase/sphingolipid hydroxylase (fatty acid hydroxylase superfamily)
LSAVLVLYPSITALIDAQNVVNEYSRYIPEQYLAVRDKAVMQVLGFVFLYLFLGAMLYYHKEQPIQQGKMNSPENQPMPQVRKTASNRINPQWSFVVGFLASLAVFVWQFVSGIMNRTSIWDALVFPLVYGIIAGCVVGITLYAVLKHRTIENER